MDFRRIEWLFLVAFIVIDIFLFAAFQRDTSGETDTSSNRSSSDTTILKEMRADNISFKAPSKKSGEGYYISTSNDSSIKSNLTSLSNQTVRYQSDGTITSTFKTPITGVDTQHPDKTLDTVVSNSTLILNGTDYTYNAKLSSRNTVVYTQEVADGPIYSRYGEIRFSLTNAGTVTGYTQGYLANVSTLREKTETISERKALIWLYQYNQIPNNTKVVWTKLAYTRYFNLKNSSVYIPTWVVAVKSNSGNNAGVLQLKHVNAFTGAILSNDSNVKTVSGSTTTSE
ncbi:two-component system regulatory protein YycI [Levilactobacillus brevis]|uniref:two-component system regulatory protein YycI n=1 Tax=Levilactobacillus brevis TaxID=1580 RepID=UPI000E098525|nr:two-component system regulatory protein YycI [Levilactobacillus brevis]MCM6798203.1 two-component system regulatory protein YycI [Levilactobacillus brevis]MCM6800851.1 two-component system regulatory protein YycI [Levilactobacillus brevis]MCM6806334.1 two-component system regulatory protein YycI [Levilactobacillus brevis]MCM6808490.1 two-component system regulatory protein YycI [Levilactobacillus brevis]MCM6814377.1 two-component system regulatory protein YycI [Levilactobacillus brevis]